MIKREELLKAIADVRTDEIVVPIMSAIKEWSKLAPEGQYYYPAGAMGYGSSVGLGLALARPDRKVIVLDGDGSLLMNLGALVTIADVSPPNLIHFVLENGLYELPGAISLPGVGQYNLADFARAAGINRIYHINEKVDLREQLEIILAAQGPVFVSVRIARGPTEPLPRLPIVQLARKFEESLRQ
ncbi:thiamine pyrophosphate-dependent enzyme [Chloroflexota bacterium]